jgi:hypothetical protein
LVANLYVVMIACMMSFVVRISVESGSSRITRPGESG